MRRLDELLTAAAERGERTGPEVLIQHLERRLAGEREQVVAAQSRRTTMVTTETRPSTPTKHPQPRRYRLALGATGFVVVAAAVVAAVLIFGGNDEVAAPASPAELLTRVEASISDMDGTSFTDISPTPLGDFETRFLEWNLALGMNPTFTNCAVDSAPANTTRATCDVAMGSDYFFSQAIGRNLETSLVVLVKSTGEWEIVAWPAPTGLVEVEQEMRAWIQTAHPELESEMFGFDYAGIVKFDRRAGELHMQYLDEFLAAR